MDSKNYHEDLSHIRSMMERSSRFISLSGLSGVFAGVVAILGAVYIYFILQREGLRYHSLSNDDVTPKLLNDLILSGLIILVLAVFSGYFFSSRKSKKISQPIWNSATKKMLGDFSIPLLTGFLFCLGLLVQEIYLFIAPATLVFYGLALVSASKHTLRDIKYLGFLQILLGLTSLFLPQFGLYLWAFGFGVVHILYGTVMYRKYN
jgi:hypothetical protein